MIESLRRENARIYSEMYELGIEPFRGTWKSISIMVVGFLLAMASMVTAFAMVVQTPGAALHDFFKSFPS